MTSSSASVMAVALIKRIRVTGIGIVRTVVMKIKQLELNVVGFPQGFIYGLLYTRVVCIYGVSVYMGCCIYGVSVQTVGNVLFSSPFFHAPIHPFKSIHLSSFIHSFIHFWTHHWMRWYLLFLLHLAHFPCWHLTLLKCSEIISSSLYYSSPQFIHIYISWAASSFLSMHSFIGSFP